MAQEFPVRQDGVSRKAGEVVQRLELARPLALAPGIEEVPPLWIVVRAVAECF